MISAEPTISVGIVEGRKELAGAFHGLFELPNSVRLRDHFRVTNSNNRLILFDNEDVEVIRADEINCRSLNDAGFMLENVAVGINFHWERIENQTFKGNLRFLATTDGKITAINEINVEDYLKSVISSEMSAEAPIELLKAHAITSRSWLVAMLERRKNSENLRIPYSHSRETPDEIVRWYDRQEHLLFDVCADDHCQRFQGITKVISKSVEEAMNETRGIFLIYADEICDARFSKACGGRSELFENCWENIQIPYLQSISDSTAVFQPVMDELNAEHWILSSPDAFCNTTDRKILQQILPLYDQETTDFFRWKVEYAREQLEEIIKTKSGIDFGTLMDLIPLKRGPSGRIYRLKIIGTKRTVSVGKELEIRRLLSKSHLYSSAFIVKIERDEKRIPLKFTLHGAGWGHGVGLCQIGAAVMAVKGFKAEEILKHYFRGADLKRLYERS